jgi:hypothetical protein
MDDVRDALEGVLWYMRFEGGRYRFTTEPNLNKVVLEREGAITEDRIEALLRDGIAAASPAVGELQVEPRVSASADLPDNQRLTLGVLDFEYRISSDATEETLRTARDVLDHHGNAWRSNKNAAILVAADGAAIAKARASARTLAALRDVKDDRHRTSRFNTEQREQLAKRLAAAEERLPQQVVMAYRHVLLLGEATTGGTKLDHIDLGPARAGARISERVIEYLRGADRLVETLAPAALLASRFGLLPEGTDVVELDTLLGYFYRLPRLPKLANPDVLRRSLAQGVGNGLFGLASGASWDADDAVLRFSESVDPSEILFQPGTFLVRAASIKRLIASRMPASGGDGSGVVGGQVDAEDEGGEGLSGGLGGGLDGGEDPTRKEPGGVAALSAVRISVHGVPGSKVREVIKVAVLPLNAVSPEVSVDLVIEARGGLAGIPRETLHLVVLEGLRQLGLTDVSVEEGSG